MAEEKGSEPPVPVAKEPVSVAEGKSVVPLTGDTPAELSPVAAHRASTKGAANGAPLSDVSPSEAKRNFADWETLMNVIPVAAVTMTDGVITIDADLLASKLGLSVEQLKAEMRRGYVYSVTEQGIDSDAGRTRLTFRYRARSWCMVVDPDGTLVEGPATANISA